MYYIALCQAVQAEETYYLHTDHLGSIKAITKDGRLQKTTDYDPFGASENLIGKFSEQRGYVGEEYDEESELSYLNARYYDPELKRFISQDPQFWLLSEEILANPQEQNSYSYSRNNPIRYSDPTGLSSAERFPAPVGGWKIGDKMGEFNGVAAYYNGIGSSSTQYSCVEYAKRYMLEVYGIRNIGPVGDARTMWNMAERINERLAAANSAYTFTRHENGNEQLPEAGDLLFWTQGKYGHVMVVTETIFNQESGAGHVEIIDQNASRQAVRVLDIQKTDKGFAVMKDPHTPVAGWLRPTPAVKQPPAIVTPAPRASISQYSGVSQRWYQRAWSTVKNYAKKLF